MKTNRVSLTTRRIANAACPPDRSQALLYDSVQPGLAVRVYPSGRKTFVVRYRTEGGRQGRAEWYTIGAVGTVSLDDARKAAGIKLGEVAKGDDPAEERREERRRERQRLEAALEAYEKDMAERGVVKRSEYMSLLRRELLDPLGNVDLDTLDQAMLVQRINTLKAQRPGAAKELRTRASVFLNWCAAQGLVKVSPLAGYRQPRKTRAQHLAAAEEKRQARALTDAEIPIVWQAAEAQGWPFGPYLQTLILTGQRRTETASMRWRDLDFKRGVWTIPAADTKSGRAHDVPLPAELIAILDDLPRVSRCPYVFPGKTLNPLAGYSKRLKLVYQITDAAGLDRFTLHDLRRTMRTGLTRLGVEEDVAEMMLNHQIGDELRRVYDKHGYPEKRTEAAQRWARHVCGLVDANDGTGNVVALRTAEAG
jgi:integrase